MRKRTLVSILTAAMAASVASVVIVSSAVGTDDPAQLNVLKNGTPTTISSSVVATLRSQGVDAATSDTAVSVQAPDGSANHWTVAQDANDVCVVRTVSGGSALNCGTNTVLRTGAIVSFTPDAAASASLGLPDTLTEATKPGPHPAQAPQLAGSATFQGIAANDVTDVAAVAGDGSVLAHAAVQNNLFALPGVPLGKVANIRLTHTSGQDTLQPLGTK